MSTIEEIADYVQRGKSPKYIEWSEFPVVNQKSVRWHGIDIEYLKFIHPDQWEKWSEERFLQKGDILWNSTGTGTIGRATIYQGLPGYEKAVVDSHVTIVRAKNYNQKLLHYWIMSPLIQSKIDRMHAGSTNQVELSKSEILKTALPLPPLNEQKRIVAKIEALQARSQSVKEELEAIRPLLDQFRQSVLAAAFRGDLTADWREKNGKITWEKTTLEKVIEGKPKNGYSPKAVDYSTPVKTLSLSATTSGKFKPEHFKYINKDIEEDSYLWLKPGDILIQRSNSLEYVGTSAIYTGKIKDFIYPDLMMKVQVIEEIASPEFINYVISAPNTKEYFKENATGTAGNMPKINQKTVMNVPVDLPPLEEQQEIICRIESLFKIADTIEKQYQQAEADLETLNQSILAKAFRGELVPQDPNDEPASVLLERIREERAKQGSSKKKPKAPEGNQLNLPGMEL